MYICDFSRSVGAGSAITRKTRGLTRSAMRLIVPPLPAASRPSNTMQILAPVALTHSWSLTNSSCRGTSSRSNSLAVIGGRVPLFSAPLLVAAECWSFFPFLCLLFVFAAVAMTSTSTENQLHSPVRAAYRLAYARVFLVRSSHPGGEVNALTRFKPPSQAAAPLRHPI